MDLSQKLRLTILLVVLGCTAGCDQASKHIARGKLGDGGFITLPGGFGEFRLAENPGSFLSFGGSLPKALRLTIFTISVGVGLLGLMAYLVLGAQFNKVLFVGLALVWAGGISNLIDRIARDGLVSDFMLIRIGPFHTGVFNVADVVIMIGGAVVACDLWRRRYQQGHKQSVKVQSQ